MATLIFSYSKKLWTLDDPLRPQASAAGGENVAIAILFVRLRKIASAANGAGREIKFLHSLAKSHILGHVPQINQGMLPQIANHITPRISPAPRFQKTFMIMH